MRLSASSTPVGKHMRYVAAITDFFKSRKWGMNLLLGSVSLLIPIVGPILLSGWHVTLLWARGDDEEPANYPPFDFQFFGKYLDRGLWPFLVSLASSMVLVPVFMILMIGPLLLAGFPEFKSEHGDGPPVLLLVSMFGIYPVIIFAFQLVLVPLVLRATIMQNFASAFDLGFAKRFLSLMWSELLVSMIFMFGVGLCLMVITVITCYIGGLLLAPVFIFGWHHLQKQLYQLYLARGGEAVPPSPKLRDLPPTLPAA